MNSRAFCISGPGNTVVTLHRTNLQWGSVRENIDILKSDLIKLRLVQAHFTILHARLHVDEALIG